MVDPPFTNCSWPPLTLKLLVDRLCAQTAICFGYWLARPGPRAKRGRRRGQDAGSGRNGAEVEGKVSWGGHNEDATGVSLADLTCAEILASLM